MPPVIVVVRDQPILAVVVPALPKDPVVNILVALVLLVDRPLIHGETWHLGKRDRRLE